jgi:hypothetical protein
MKQRGMQQLDETRIPRITRMHGPAAPEARVRWVLATPGRRAPLSGRDAHRLIIVIRAIRVPFQMSHVDRYEFGQS